MNFSIDKCTKKSFSSFVKSHYNLFADSFLYECEFNDYINKLFTYASHFTIEENETIVGMMCVYFNRKQRFAYIPYLCVDAQFSGRGIATQLVKGLIDSCNNDYNYIGLEVRILNQSAFKLYRKLGFVEIGRNDEKIQMHKIIREKYSK